jgi:hypothetical protein
LARIRLSDPTPAYYDIAIVEHCGLAGSDGALRQLERNNDFIFTSFFDHGWSRFVTVANFYRDTHWLTEILDRDQIHTMGAQRARVKMLIAAYDNLLVSSVDLDYVKRRSRRHTQSFALADGKVVNAVVLADHFTAGRN